MFTYFLVKYSKILNSEPMKVYWLYNVLLFVLILYVKGTCKVQNKIKTKQNYINKSKQNETNQNQKLKRNKTNETGLQQYKTYNQLCMTTYYD